MRSKSEDLEVEVRSVGDKGGVWAEPVAVTETLMRRQSVLGTARGSEYPTWDRLVSSGNNIGLVPGAGQLIVGSLGTAFADADAGSAAMLRPWRDPLTLPDHVACSFEDTGAVDNISDNASNARSDDLLLIVLMIDCQELGYIVLCCIMFVLPEV
jgi:hypothetical protein